MRGFRLAQLIFLELFRFQRSLSSTTSVAPVTSQYDPKSKQNKAARLSLGLIYYPCFISTNSFVFERTIAQAYASKSRIPTHHKINGQVKNCYHKTEFLPRSFSKHTKRAHSLRQCIKLQCFRDNRDLHYQTISCCRKTFKE